MATPDFLVIGAQKSGTTWLDKIFKSHKKLWTPPVKELHYFDELYMPDTFNWTQKHREQHGIKSLKYITSDLSNVDIPTLDLSYLIARQPISKHWYERIFDFAPEGSVKGEMSPEYSLLSEEHVREISRKYPGTKIIFTIREPVARAVSGLKMRLRQQGFDSDSDGVAIDNFLLGAANDWDVVTRGNYGSIIEKWSSAFGSQRLLVLLSDDLRDRPGKALFKLANFLEVDASLFKGDLEEKVHVGSSYPISEKVMEAIAAAQRENSEWYESCADQFSS